MIWKSIIGKLWITIIGLVTVVLLFLTMLLLQFFENYNVDQVEKQMTAIGNKVSEMLEKAPSDKADLATVSEIVDAYSARSVVISDHTYWASPAGHHLPTLDRHFFLTDSALKDTLVSNKQVVKQGDFLIKTNGKEKHERMMIVGVPVHFKSGADGAVYVYQSLQVIRDTTYQSQKLIYIGAGIAIILTTFFAFFLSTRIGAPLRKMKSAAQQVALGNFDLKVPVVTRDEVGELAVTFNQMAKQLETNMTELNQEKEQLAGIVNSMADGVMMFNNRGELLTSNPPAQRFLNSWYFENSSGKDTGRRVPDVLEELFNSVAAKENQEIKEVSCQGRFWVVIMTPLYNHNNVRGAVAVLRDMTEERQLDQLRKGFIANVSHELRTPIAMMQGYSEAIIDDVAQNEAEKKEMAQIILDESLRMGRLVNELLDLAKLEAGHFQLNKTDVLLSDFLNRAVYKFNNLANEAGIKLVLEDQVPAGQVFTLDPDRIEQVMTNLIDNAIRHTKKGGTVDVKAEMLKKGLAVSVTDTGVGIAKEDLPFVFERFYKADKARTRGKSGTGLGLAIAKNIVEAHGGEIHVNSKIGEGTTFHFFLPRVVKKTGEA